MGSPREHAQSKPALADACIEKSARAEDASPKRQRPQTAQSKRDNVPFIARMTRAGGSHGHLRPAASIQWSPAISYALRRTVDR
jgi:hypothetical protein